MIIERLGDDGGRWIILSDTTCKHIGTGQTFMLDPEEIRRYKTYRNWVLNEIKKGYKWKVHGVGTYLKLCQ